MTADPNSMFIPEPTKQLVLEATLEIEGICSLLQREIKRIDHKELVAFRSMLLRAKALNQEVMVRLTGEIEPTTAADVDFILYGDLDDK